MSTISATTASSAHSQLDLKDWALLGLGGAALAIAGVLVVQALALSLMPALALFPPLDNLARSALFTLVPALGATMVFAWLARRSAQPVAAFLKISLVVLLLSLIPDFLYPDPDKTLLASTVAAFLHVLAGALIVGTLVWGYQRKSQNG
jgi:hypothetical protein